MKQKAEDLAAERAVLGAILADNGVIAAVAEVIESEDFSSRPHAQIWQAIIALDGKQKRVDHLTLAEELKLRGQLANVGGPPYLMGLDLQVPFAHNAVKYAQVVKAHAGERFPGWMDEIRLPVGCTPTGLFKKCPRCSRLGIAVAAPDHSFSFIIVWPPRSGGIYGPDQARQDICLSLADLLRPSMGCGYD